MRHGTSASLPTSHSEDSASTQGAELFPSTTICHEWFPWAGVPSTRDRVGNSAGIRDQGAALSEKGTWLPGTEMCGPLDRFTAKTRAVLKRISKGQVPVVLRQAGEISRNTHLCRLQQEVALLPENHLAEGDQGQTGVGQGHGDICCTFPEGTCLCDHQPAGGRRLGRRVHPACPHSEDSPLAPRLHASWGERPLPLCPGLWGAVASGTRGPSAPACAGPLPSAKTEGSGHHP